VKVGSKLTTQLTVSGVGMFLGDVLEHAVKSWRIIRLAPALKDSEDGFTVLWVYV
jgi:hypothetical protein